jgi:hypothetical protein
MMPLHRLALVFFLVAWWSQKASCQTSEILSAQLNVLWSITVEAGPEPDGLTLLDVPQFPGFPQIALAQEGDRPCLLLNISTSGPGNCIHLLLNGWNLHISSADKDVWIGGVTNLHMEGLAPHKVSDAYLAKVSRSGEVLLERRFGYKNEMAIQSLSASPSGDVVVAGRNDDTAWLARISGDGRLLWERSFGLAKGVSVLTGQGRIVVAGFEAQKQEFHTYQDDVSIWIFDDEGRLLDHRTVRAAINRQLGAAFGTVILRAAGDAIYLASSWSKVFGTVEPTEVAKLSWAGEVSWTRQLPGTIIQWPMSSGPRLLANCMTGMNISSLGEPIVICTRAGMIDLYRLRSTNGNVVRLPIVFAGCRKKGPLPNLPLAIALFRVSRETMVLLGSRKRGDPGVSCTWMGEVSASLMDN